MKVIETYVVSSRQVFTNKVLESRLRESGHLYINTFSFYTFYLTNKGMFIKIPSHQSNTRSWKEYLIDITKLVPDIKETLLLR